MSYHRSRGLGDAQTTSRTVGTVGSLTASGVTAALGSGVFGAAAASFVPVIGPVLGAAIMGIQVLIQNSGCGQTCIVTSQWANQAAAKLQQVLDGYFSLPAPRTQSQQAAALGAFDAVWQTLVAQCSQAGTGDAGVRCISDRQRGACTWKQKYAPVYPGEPNVGDCWNWFNGYRDPIAQDPVVPDPSVASDISSSVSSIFGGSTAGGGVDWVPLALIAGLVAVGVAL